MQWQDTRNWALSSILANAIEHCLRVVQNNPIWTGGGSRSGSSGQRPSTS